MPCLVKSEIFIDPRCVPICTISEFLDHSGLFCSRAKSCSVICLEEFISKSAFSCRSGANHTVVFFGFLMLGERTVELGFGDVLDV